MSDSFNCEMTSGSSPASRLNISWTNGFCNTWNLDMWTTVSPGPVDYSPFSMKKFLLQISLTFRLMDVLYILTKLLRPVAALFYASLSQAKQSLLSGSS